MDSKERGRKANEYNKNATVVVNFRLHKVKDAELIDVLSNIDNKSKFLKGLIRDYKNRA